jgi:hypothetical protein
MWGEINKSGHLPRSKGSRVFALDLTRFGQLWLAALAHRKLPPERQQRHRAKGLWPEGRKVWLGASQSLEPWRDQPARRDWVIARGTLLAQTVARRQELAARAFFLRAPGALSANAKLVGIFRASS